MLRETTFLIGGVLAIGLGVALAIGLYWANAGLPYLDAWLASGISVGFGAFFAHVAREEHRSRLRFLEELDQEPSESPVPPAR